MKLVTSHMMNEWIVKASEGPRLRINYNIHEHLSDPLQRLFIAARLSSYFRPHRHPGKSELAIVIRGLFDVIIFDDAGVVTERVAAGPQAETFALEIPPDAWHTWVPIVDESVFFEVKQGPYHPATAALFAPWSPEEGSPQVKEFQIRLQRARIGERVT